jgi:drug/metabolite transporter (DMT)-like permease
MRATCYNSTNTLTMEPGEALGIAAQIAVALAGFAGVVVVFRRESVHEWSSADKLRLRFLLANSLLPLSLCMLGLLLLTIKPMPPGIWRWCSGVAFVVSLLFAIRMTTIFRRVDPREVQRTRSIGFLFYLLGAFGVAVMLLQLSNTTLLGAFWPFFTAINYQLVTAVLQFARMILLLPE